MPEPAKTTKAKTADLSNRFAALAAPAPEVPEEEPPARPARQPRAVSAVTAAPPMAAEQSRPKDWPVRIPLNVDEEMRRALEEARLDDRIETTARIRAMIQLWQEDDRLRARVNKRARDLRPGSRIPHR
jgi:hypothetical protein